MEKMREANKAAQKTVRVTPANHIMRRLLKHPHAGGFPKEGGAEWPDDRFTKRRIADGDITREDDAPKDRSRSHRRQEDSSAA
ncbi:hypothetical protein NLM33_18760 [Bradyrhizobium sp. CCGUVB1N3]|uniref:hypothetical protein n=1 Tax=Bradyrhizobium sp. CCGUVB1N3 TaxID=2949629 RepID=UPI0020B2FCAA|nr:hypothetical protein [Bradyrhizobium sp. CCGUVB1N3]MCP3471420.1 hypothetical protein [Bradyrhizobium sp. CCGUVB1N3]MCP3472360.1 hypothetical protein [Bradyrhizobium sp. CCGUVB1N3]